MATPWGPLHVSKGATSHSQVSPLPVPREPPPTSIGPPSDLHGSPTEPPRGPCPTSEGATLRMNVGLFGLGAENVTGQPQLLHQRRDIHPLQPGAAPDVKILELGHPGQGAQGIRPLEAGATIHRKITQRWAIRPRGSLGKFSAIVQQQNAQVDHPLQPPQNLRPTESCTATKGEFHQLWKFRPRGTFGQLRDLSQLKPP